jgi:competence protein ComEC
VRARGYLGRPAGYANRIPSPPGPWRLRVKTLRLLEVTAPPGPLARASSRLRAQVEEALAAAEAAGRGAAAPGLQATEPGPDPEGRGAVPAAVQAEAGPDPEGPEADGASEWPRPTGGGPALGPELGRSSSAALLDAPPGYGPALVRALVLGDPNRLPPRWRRGLRRTGLAHLLAVSGLHAGLVAGVVLLAAGFLPRPARIALALVAVAGYLAVVGPRPSMLRASGMALIAGVALLARRGPATANALAVVAGGLALARPELVADVGFRLTVTATAGIVFVAPRLEAAWSAREPGAGGRAADARAAGRERRRQAVRRWLLRALAATVGAQLASLPFALPVFHLASWAAPLLNLVAVPYTALALALCLGWSALAVASPAAAGGLLPLLDALAAPYGWPAVGPPAAWGVVAAVAPAGAVWALAALAAAWLFAPRRRAWLLPLVAVCAWWSCGWPPGGYAGPGRAGAGDAELRAPGAIGAAGGAG